MKHIETYKTISGENSRELDANVNEFIRQGFQPFGSPYLAQSDESVVYYQALVKFVEE